MALVLDYEFAYRREPVIPVRLRNGTAWVDTVALLDTGADVTVFDRAWQKIDLHVAFVAGLATSVGNLLGRDFFEQFDFGLHHGAALAHWRIYLGRV